MTRQEEIALGFLAIIRTNGGAIDDGGGSLFTDRIINDLADLIAAHGHVLTNDQITLLVMIGSLMSQQQTREEDAEALTEQLLGGAAGGGVS